jgi:hypothetical protein
MPMYISGYVISNDETYIIDTALFDTGASSANYISQSYVDKYIDIFEPYILAHNSSVRLGDSTTEVLITHIITLNISFLDTCSITHEGLLNFSIMKMSIDMIIGIESILFTFYELILDMLRAAKTRQSSHFNLTLQALNPYLQGGGPKGGGPDPDPSQVGISTNDFSSIISTGFEGLAASTSAENWLKPYPPDPHTPSSHPHSTITSLSSNRNLKKLPRCYPYTYKTSHPHHNKITPEIITPQRPYNPPVTNTRVGDCEHLTAPVYPVPNQYVAAVDVPLLDEVFEQDLNYVEGSQVMKGYTGNSVSPSISLPDPQFSNPEAPGLIAGKSVLFLSDVIADGRIEHASYPSTSCDIPKNNPVYEGCQPTFTTPTDPIAPEELLFPDPCSFTGPLNFLGVDRKTVLDTYYGYLETNINPDFINACPKVIDFMKSDIALSVFCPTEWHGIRDIPLLDLEVSPLLPKRMYTRARTIKDILMENAKKEFDRLCLYMYVPSNSPIASPLVIAPKPTPPYVRFCGD